MASRSVQQNSQKVPLNIHTKYVSVKHMNTRACMNMHMYIKRIQPESNKPYRVADVRACAQYCMKLRIVYVVSVEEEILCTYLLVTLCG